MSVIEASSARCKTLADGTLQITVNVEPNDAQAAFAMFGKPGAPMALAALVVGHAQAGKAPDEPKPAAVSTKPEPAEKPDHALSRWAALRCVDRQFWQWAERQNNFRDGPINSIEEAADWMRKRCAVASRAEFDTDPAAAERFKARVMRPWQKRCIDAGIT